MRPLKIGFLMHSVNPRGGVIHTLELAGALHRLGHDVTVMAVAHPRQSLFRSVEHRFELVPLGTQGHDLQSMVRSRIDAYVRHLSSSAKPDDFDVLHAQDGIGANALADLTDRGLIRGYAATVHHIDHWPSEEVNALQRRAIHRAGMLFCVSRLWQRKLLADYLANATLICNGVDRQRFTCASDPGDVSVARRLGIRPNAPLVLSIGGIEPRKNTLELLQAFILLRREYPEAQWVIVGGASLLDHSAYQASFYQALNASGLRVDHGDVIVTGALPDADLPALMRLAGVVAFPSIHEGFGLVVIEALACGAPVMVSRIEPFTEYLGDTDVFWADPNDRHSIARALGEGLRTAHRRTAPPICATFSWSQSAALHVEQYRRWVTHTPAKKEEDIDACHVLHDPLAGRIADPLLLTVTDHQGLPSRR
jgi:glycosyltransferase-like protein